MAAFPPSAPNLFTFLAKKQKGFPLKSGCEPATINQQLTTK
jgi:hypothetical protein